MYQRLYEKASAERRLRADGYRRQEDRFRCVVADALLKRALGAEHYQTGKNEFGKPYVKDSGDFCYNLSHSGRYVVIAWGKSEVGVDVQQHRDDTDLSRLAKRCFTTEELDYIRQDPGKFYEIWTKKESHIKYTGQGLRQGLGTFCVLMPEPPIRYHYRVLEGGYSLSLCTSEDACAFELLAVQDLL